MDNLRQRLQSKTTGGARQLYNQFKNMDRDNSGTIDATEFQHFLKHWNIEVSTRQVKSIISQLDLDGNGGLDYSEFVKKVLPEDYPEGKTARPGCRPQWLKTEPGYDEAIQLQKHREQKKKQIQKRMREQVDRCPNRDKLIQRTTNFFQDKTGISFSEFEKLLEGFGIQLSIQDLKLVFAFEANAERMHMSGGHTSGCGRMPLLNLLGLLVGRERALYVWLTREQAGNGIAHMMEFTQVPLHETEFHRQGLPLMPAG